MWTGAWKEPDGRAWPGCSPRQEGGAQCPAPTVSSGSLCASPRPGCEGWPGGLCTCHDTGSPLLFLPPASSWHGQFPRPGLVSRAQSPAVPHTRHTPQWPRSSESAAGSPGQAQRDSGEVGAVSASLGPGFLACGLGLAIAMVGQRAVSARPRGRGSLCSRGAPNLVQLLDETWWVCSWCLSSFPLSYSDARARCMAWAPAVYPQGSWISQVPSQNLCFVSLPPSAFLSGCPCLVPAVRRVKPQQPHPAVGSPEPWLGWPALLPTSTLGREGGVHPLDWGRVPLASRLWFVHP